MNIKKFYLKEYPTDECGSEINPKATFQGLCEILNENKCVYEYLGVGDSLVRERCFQKLSVLCFVDYDVIYRKWLNAPLKWN